jgi:uncharacterized protein YbcI
LIANVVHINLNARVGDERFAVDTIKALSSTGVDVELVTLEKPDNESILNAYRTEIDCNVKKIRTLRLSQIIGAKALQ